MNYYKGLYYIESYNVGFMGGWRCGIISIDGHYSFVTDMNEFVIWKFGTYESLTSIQNDYQEPVLNEVEHHFCNDILLEEIRRGMFNDISPNLTDIERSLWDNIYGDQRITIPEQWKKLKHYKFFKHNVSLNVHSGDTVKNIKTGETINVDYRYDLKAINKDDDYVLIDRYDYFPELKFR